MGIEPTLSGWEPGVLPLNYTRPAMQPGTAILAAPEACGKMTGSPPLPDLLMLLHVNGQPTDLPSGFTARQLLERMELAGKRVEFFFGALPLIDGDGAPARVAARSRSHRSAASLLPYCSRSPRCRAKSPSAVSGIHTLRRACEYPARSQSPPAACRSDSDRHNCASPNQESPHADSSPRPLPCAAA